MTTSSSFNPNTTFGGTWTRIKDRFLLADGNYYTNGNTGGESTHSLTINELPPHKHYVVNSENAKEWYLGKPGGASQDSSQGVSFSGGVGRSTTFETTEVGGGYSHNNMPPYLVVRVWKRTA
jgi:microcystin-dependent protein